LKNRVVINIIRKLPI